MTPEQFCYWLQGRAELLPFQAPTEKEWQVIVDHLQLVFEKKTPERIDLVKPLATESRIDGWPVKKPDFLC